MIIPSASPSGEVRGFICDVQKFLGLEEDGVAGAQTWTAIAKHFGVATGPSALAPEVRGQKSEVSGIGDELARIAEGQIGTQEDPKHQNRGSAILKYQEATNLEGQGWPWCAAFVDWCVEQLFARHPEWTGKYVRPETAAAFGLIEWGVTHGAEVFHPSKIDPQRGDIVVYTFSHCGIVAEVASDPRGDFDFRAVEGNSNVDGSRDGYAVVKHARNFSSVNRFIRIPEVSS